METPSSSQPVVTKQFIPPYI